MEEPLLAEAFQSEDAIVLDESVTAGDYQITLAGMVSGEDLSVPTDYNGEIINDRTYAVFRVARADGAPLTDYPNLKLQPPGGRLPCQLRQRLDPGDHHPAVHRGRRDLLPV